VPLSPSGIVTLLFTDIEGSTRLWEEEPEVMRVALACHDGLVHTAIGDCGGRVVKSTGDGVFAAFGCALDGVRAAVSAQVALAGAEWPEGVMLRVRMGVHLGQVTEQDGDYFGPEVNRAARVMSVAHGGQVVCSAAVGEQVRAEFALVDLGEHRLRDLQSPVHLFQVEVPGLWAVFPPLRSLDAYRSNLPYELSSFVGREAELRTIGELVRGSRVVSIVGVGGVGKTRVALQVGSELLPDFPDGVWLCELAPVLEPEDIPDAIAAAVGYTPAQGVAVGDGLPRFLERKHLLLIVDNCEHLLGAVTAFVTTTAAHAARVSVLATSREALGVRGEHIFPLPSLTMPVADDRVSVLASEAGGLFVARAGEARGEFDLDETNAKAVCGLCARLDGIPLAIELAAAQTALMTPGEILTRLDRQFRLLTGGRRVALERHQTLRAAIDWSYDLLDDRERALLDRLSTCVAGFDLDAAVALAAGIGADEFDAFELLGALVAKSLVERSERDGVTRFRLLEMIRQYAAERLNATAASENARDDHAGYYLPLASALFAEIATEHDYDVLERLETETPNIAAAGRWLLANERIAELMSFFDALAYVDPTVLAAPTLDELGTIASDAVESPNASTLPGFQNACFAAAMWGYVNGDLAEYRRMVELGHSAPDEPAVRSLINNAAAVILDGDAALALKISSRAVERARQGDDPIELSFALALNATFASIQDPGGGVSTAGEALAVARRTGSAVARLYPLLALATAARRTDPARALAAAEECARIDRTHRRAWSHICQGAAAQIRIHRGEMANGLTAIRDILRHFDENGERLFLSLELGALADELAPTHPELAIEIAAISESNTIAPYAAFTTHPELSLLIDKHPSFVAATRARTATMTYDEAINFVLTTIDRLIDEGHRPNDT
jgi:predicted ATPase/class 3 adenylate cyclase